VKGAVFVKPKDKDLDEIKSSPAAERKLPWWIKEVDKPTVDIDWSRMQRFNCSNIMFNDGFAQAVGPENAMKLGGRAAEKSKKSILDQEHHSYQPSAPSSAPGSMFQQNSVLYPKTLAIPATRVHPRKTREWFEPPPKSTGPPR
jgi:hypothetical protein